MRKLTLSHTATQGTQRLWTECEEPHHSGAKLHAVLPDGKNIEAGI